MTPFEAATSWSPGWTLGLGVAALLTHVGLGAGALRLAGVRLAAGSWAVLVSALAGSLVTSVAVQALGYSGMASVPALRGAAAVLGGLGAAGLWFGISSMDRRPTLPRPTLVDAVLLAPIALAVGAGLLVAIAPADHIDTIYYHLMVPRRILEEGALGFHRFPVHAAVHAQLVHHFAATPLHALGAPEAAHVAGYLLWPVVLVAVHDTVRAAGQPRAWAHVVTGVAGVGMVTSVWYAVGGAHAVGDAAGAALVLALVRSGPHDRARAVEIGVLVAACAGSKLSMAPLAAVAAAWTCWRARSALPLVPGALALGAPLVMTALASGSPFGPYAAGLVGESAYDPRELTAHFAVLAGKAAAYRPADVARFAALVFHPALWLALLGLVWRGGRSGRWALAVVLGQGLLVLALLPPDPRYLGGTQLGALALAGAVAPTALARLSARPVVAVAATVLLLGPWAALTAGPAGDRAGVVLGTTPRAAYLDERLPFWPDLVALDARLPEEALLLLDRVGTAGGLNAAHTPRPVYFHPADLPEGSPPPHLFWVGAHDRAEIAAWMRHRGFELGDLVYENRHARWWRPRGERRGVVRAFALSPH